MASALDIASLLSRAEDATFDRMQSIGSKEDRDRAGEKIASFASSKGGVLLFGQADDRQMVGIRVDDQTLITRLGELSTLLDPRPTIDGPYFFDVGGARLAAIVVVSLGRGGPCTYNNQAYSRVMDRSEKIPAKELRRIWSAMGQISFEERPTLAPVTAIDRETLNEYTKDARAKGSFNETAYLIARKLSTQDGDALNLTNLGVIVLAQDPSEWLPNAKIHLIRFKGITPGERTGSTMLSQPLHKLIASCVAYIKTFQPVSERREGIRRIEEPLIPEYVVREALVNAIAHRDYEHPGETLVRIFDDRIEISNPSVLTPDEWKSVLLNGIPVHHNPMVYQYLREMQLGEGAGQGIPIMRDLMDKANLPEPIFVQIRELFNIVLYNRPAAGSADSLSQQLLRVIHQERIVSSTRIMDKFKVSRPYALRLLKSLASKGYLKHTGGGKTSRFEIAD